jgi:hypothetical protein
MSWDVILLNLPPDIRSINDLGDDFDSVLAPVSDVRKLVSHVVPSVDLSDPGWGILEADDYSIEFSIGEDDPCTSLMLHIRGTESALEPIRALCAATGWKAFDCSDGDLMDWSGDPGKGLREWRAYRDQVIPGAPERGVSLPMEGDKRVFFDALPTRPRPSESSRKPWWKFWA